MQFVSSDFSDKENEPTQFFSVIDSGDSFCDPVKSSDLLSKRLKGFANLHYQLNLSEKSCPETPELCSDSKGAPVEWSAYMKPDLQTT